MIDNFGKKECFNLALPMGRVRLPKFLYIILFVLGILVLIAGGLNFYLKNFKKNTTTINQTTIKLSKSEISEELVIWLEKQRDERGIYSGDEVCDKGICRGNLASNRSGFSVLDGKIKYIKNIDRSIIDDLNKYNNRDIVHIIQGNYLICNFLYDIYNYPNTSDEVKNLTEKICFDIKYELSSKEDWDSIYGEKGDINTVDLLSQILQKLENIFVKNETIPGSTVDYDFDLTRNYGYFISEFATRYKWKNKDEDYKGFMVSLNNFLDLYSDSNNNFDQGEGCGLAWGLIDMGEFKQIPELKKYGEMIYSKEAINQDINKMTLRQMLTCGLLADKLNDKKMVNVFIDQIINNFYDKNKSSISDQSNQSNFKLYDVNNNGMFLILLNGISEENNK